MLENLFVFLFWCFFSSFLKNEARRAVLKMMRKNERQTEKQSGKGGKREIKDQSKTKNTHRLYFHSLRLVVTERGNPSEA